MKTNPLISVTVVVKNGMPYLRDAIESLRKQTYKNFEVIVQDGMSSDGTVDYLKSVEELNISIRSEIDSGSAQGWNRAIKRCKGNIIGSLDADNILKPNSFEVAVKTYKKNPDVAVVYGNNVPFKETSSIGKRVRDISPIREFDLIRLLRCDLVPSFEATFFFTKNCKKYLYIDEAIKFGGDYDLWLRVSHLKIKSIPNILAFVRKHRKSYTQTPKLYHQFVEYKIRALKKYIANRGHDEIVDSLLKYCTAGIYAWAADSVYTLEGNSKDFKFFVDKTLALDPYSERIRFINQRIDMNRPINRLKTRIYKFYKAIKSN